MKTYELTYIVSPQMTSEEAEAKAKEMESAIQGREGIILKQSNPVAKTFAFPIGKSASGFFGFLEFQLEPEKLPELKDVVQKDEKILRHMVIIKEPVRIRKERRARIKPVVSAEADKKPEILEKEDAAFSAAPIKEEHKKPEVKEKEKVELKDIEEKLEELLGE